MPNKMLIDATHPEETRVVVVRGNRVEEFDFETAQRKQLRGNIYLAKVTRVEPSLQAAFIEYGGNRHGFLAFSEIHPDYYQIPVADRQALIEADERAHREAEEETENRSNRRRPRHRNSRRRGNGERVQSEVIENASADPSQAAQPHQGHAEDLHDENGHAHAHDTEHQADAEHHDDAGHHDHDGHSHDHEHAHDENSHVDASETLAAVTLPDTAALEVSASTNEAREEHAHDEHIHEEHAREYESDIDSPHAVHVYSMHGNGPHAELHVAVQPNLPFARLGAGGVHHVAFRTPTEEQYHKWHDRLNSMGVRNSGEIDQFWGKMLPGKNMRVFASGKDLELLKSKARPAPGPAAADKVAPGTNADVVEMVVQEVEQNKRVATAVKDVDDKLWAGMMPVAAGSSPGLSPVAMKGQPGFPEMKSECGKGTPVPADVLGADMPGGSTKVGKHVRFKDFKGC